MTMYRSSSFAYWAKETARAMGHPSGFVIAVLIILAWALTGPIFGFSDTWQLVINTGTTIVTFLMVFLIQNTQNRDSEAVQLKLDELIRAVQGAHNALLDLEELSEEELDRLKASYEALARRAREELLRGLLDTGAPEIQPQEPDIKPAGASVAGHASSLVLFDQNGQVVWSAALAAHREGSEA
jgi:low affinity Fe/Cu permease